MGPQPSVIDRRVSVPNRALRRIHLLSTIWFIASIGYLLVLMLRQVGFQWWLIFSLSGPSMPWERKSQREIGGAGCVYC